MKPVKCGEQLENERFKKAKGAIFEAQRDTVLSGEFNKNPRICGKFGETRLNYMIQKYLTSNVQCEPNKSKKRRMKHYGTSSKGA